MAPNNIPKITPKRSVKRIAGKSLSELTTGNAPRTNNMAYAELMEAQRCWDGLSEARENRRRYRRYLFGDQWGDIIRDPDTGRDITEEDYIKKQGKVPLKQNLIHRLVKAVMGQYRGNQTEPVCMARDREEQQLGEMMSAVLQYNYQVNKMTELDARAMMEFLVSGAVFQKESWAWRFDKYDVWSDMVNFNRIFFDNKMEDPRHWDCMLIGEIHDMSLGKMLGAFARNAEEAKRLREIYQYAGNEAYLYNYAQNLSTRLLDNISFLTASEPGMCRVIEIWKKERKARLRCHDVLTGEWYKAEVDDEKNIAAENKRRLAEGLSNGMVQEDIPFIATEWFMDEYWYFRYLSPMGHVLREGETPFAHKGHPYSFKLYPFIDGKIHSFVGDVIDQQRYINRLVTQADFAQANAAKGVLMVPESALGDYTPEQFASQWTKSNGMIVYKPLAGGAAGGIPQQITANSIQAGTFEFINLQFKFMEDISGAHASLQGASPQAGTSGIMFAQQTQNAANNLVDILDSFKSFREDRDMKKLKMILQFYQDKMMLNSINSGAGKMKVFDPSKVRNVEFDINIAESTNTPVMRMMANDLLMQLYQSQAIDVEQLLENGSFPFADNLLQSIRSKREQMAQEQQQQMAAQVPNGLPGTEGLIQ